MRAEMAVLAQSVRDRPDGLMDVIGVGITELWSETFPATGRFAVALRLVLDGDESYRWHELTVALTLSGARLSSLPPPLPIKALHVVPGQRAALNCMLNLDVGLPHEGELLIELIVDNEIRMPHLRLDVRRGNPPAVDLGGAWTPV
jgi:hypothetical protein